MKFSEAVSTYHQLCKVLSPWRHHQHCFGCDCAYLPEKFRKSTGWWFRSTPDDYEAFTAFDDAGKAAEDARAVAEGFVLCEEE